MEMDEIRVILQALEGTSVTELEVQRGDVRVRIQRQVGGAARSEAPVPRPAAAESETPNERDGSQAERPAPATGLVVKSPIVGTFYRSPDPNSPPFVNVGDRVRVGQVLCIIEAMKLMNEIEAETAGEIVQVHPENGQPVQYGDPLFTIKPEK